MARSRPAAPGAGTYCSLPCMGWGGEGGMEVGRGRTKHGMDQAWEGTAQAKQTFSISWGGQPVAHMRLLAHGHIKCHVHLMSWSLHWWLGQLCRLAWKQGCHQARASACWSSTGHLHARKTGPLPPQLGISCSEARQSGISPATAGSKQPWAPSPHNCVEHPGWATSSRDLMKTSGTRVGQWMGSTKGPDLL